MGPDGRCELWCGWGHIENKFSNMPKYGYCSDHQRTSNQKCNVVGCTVKPGSLCGNRLEKCPNGKGYHIAFSTRCVKKAVVTNAVRQSRNMGLAGRESTRVTWDMATASNRVVLGSWPQKVAKGDGDEDEMADMDEAEEGVGQARDVMMGETACATRTVTDTETET